MLFHEKVPAAGIHSHIGQIIPGITLQSAPGRYFSLVLGLTGQFPVRTCPVGPVRKQLVVELQSGIIGIEREAAPVKRLGPAQIPVHK